MKKILFIIAACILLLPLSTNAYTVYSGVVFRYPYSAQVLYSQTGDGNVRIYAKEQAFCNRYPLEDCEFLYIAYLKVAPEYASNIAGSNMSGYNIAYLRNAFYDYPERIERLYEMDNYITVDKNCLIIAKPVFSYKGEIMDLPFSEYYFGAIGKVKDLEESYESDGIELSLRIGGNNTVYAGIDATAAEENPEIYINFYDSLGELIQTEQLNEELEKTSVSSGEKYRFSGGISVSLKRSAAYAQAFIGETASALTGLGSLKLSYSKDGENSVFTVGNGNIVNVRAYGPLLAYSDRMSDYRYFRTSENKNLVDGNSVKIHIDGRYLIVGTNADGVEYKEFVDIPDYCENGNRLEAVLQTPLLSSEYPTIGIDLICCSEEPNIYAALYNYENELILVKPIDTDNLNKIYLGDGSRIRYKSYSDGITIYDNNYIKNSLAYIRIFAWDDALCPLSASVKSMSDDLEISTLKEDNGTVIRVCGNAVNNVKAYGPLPDKPMYTNTYSYNKITAAADYRIVRHFRNDSIVSGDIVYANETGWYMVSAEDDDGTEYRIFINIT